MASVLTMTEDRYAALRRHLFDGPGEQVGFLFVEEADVDGMLLRVTGHYFCGPEEYDRQAVDHVALTDEAQARVIKQAWDRRVALVECHPHGILGGPACFSAYDAIGLAAFAPHVRWRLKGQLYAALVFGPHNFDALLWQGRSKMPQALDLFRVGDRQLRPTGRTLNSPRLLDLLGGERGQ